MASEEAGKQIAKDTLDKMIEQAAGHPGKLVLNTGPPIELSQEEISDRLAQLPAGALPNVEANLRRASHGLPPVTYSDEVCHSGIPLEDLLDSPLDQIAKDALNGPKTVDLVLYTGGERRVVGKATVVNGTVYAAIDQVKMDGEAISNAVSHGQVAAVSIGFEYKQLHKVAEFGYVPEATFKKPDYDFKPTRPFPPVQYENHSLLGEFPSLEGISSETMKGFWKRDQVSDETIDKIAKQFGEPDDK